MSSFSLTLSILSQSKVAYLIKLGKKRQLRTYTNIGCYKNINKGSIRVYEILHYDTYLGLLSLIGRNKKASLDYIKERVWRKLQGWGEKLLSQASREVLIKAVVQAIPTYTMSCFMLPLGLCHEIEGLVCKFWWGKGEIVGKYIG